MLGEILKKVRNDLRYTQDDVAEHLNVIRQTYSAYETGRSKPDSETLNALAKFFDVSADYLLGNTDDPLPPSKRLEAQTNDPAIITIQRLRNNLSTKDNEKMMRMLRIQFEEDFPND